jgi:WD40 repeat protein
MKKSNWALVALCAVVVGCATTSTVPVVLPVALDSAVEAGAREIESVLPSGSKVAVLYFSSPSEAFSNYVIEELMGYLVRDRKVVVVDRNSLDIIRREQNFQLSGEVDDNSAQAIGKMLGAQSVVAGSLVDLGGTYRFRVYTLNVETAAREAAYMTTIRPDAQITHLLGNTPSVAKNQAPQQTPVASSATKTVNAENFVSLGVLARFSDTVFPVIYSPDGKRILAGRINENHVLILDAESGRELLRLSVNFAESDAVAYSPDGRRIITGTYEGTIIIWDATNGRELQTLSGHDGAVCSVSYSPDGRRIISSSYDGTAIIWDTASGRELRKLSRYGSESDVDISAVAYSPDGRRIIAWTWDDDHEVISIWDAESGRELQSLSDLRSWNNELFPMSYSPDGRRIIAGTYGGPIIMWDAASGRELRRLYHDEDEYGGATVAYSPDGKRIVSTDQNIKVWDAESGLELRTIFTDVSDGLIISTSFRPDGNQLVSSSNKGVIRLWGIDSGSAPQKP